MIVSSKNFNFNDLILSSLTLDTFEYCYLSPLLEQTGLYSGHTDVVLIAQKLSQQTKNICHLKRIFQKSLNNADECINQESHIHFFLQKKIFNLETHLMSYENILIAYYKQHIFSGIYIFKPHFVLFFDEYFYQMLQPIAFNIILKLSQNNTFEENIFTCITCILIYKIWKIEHWYSVISKLAFDSQEMKIAKHCIQMTKLEYNMILMLMNLFK